VDDDLLAQYRAHAGSDDAADGVGAAPGRHGYQVADRFGGVALRPSLRNGQEDQAGRREHPHPSSPASGYFFTREKSRCATQGVPGAWSSWRTSRSVHASISGLAFSCSGKCLLRSLSETNSYRTPCLAQPETETRLRMVTQPPRRGIKA